jgi:hypothetical protein
MIPYGCIICGMALLEGVLAGQIVSQLTGIIRMRECNLRQETSEFENHYDTV